MTFESELAHDKLSKVDISSLSKQQKEKHKVEVINLKKVVSVNHSFRDEFTK